MIVGMSDGDADGCALAVPAKAIRRRAVVAKCMVQIGMWCIGCSSMEKCGSFPNGVCRVSRQLLRSTKVVKM